VITSAANPRLRLIRRLRSRRQRQRLGLFVVEGEDLVEAGRAAGIEPVDVLVAGEDISPELLAEVSELAHPPRVMAVYRTADLPSWTPRTVTLALWHVADPGNVGTLVRAADAFGAGVRLSAGCADPTGPKALRASMGALFRVPIGPFAGDGERRIALVASGGARVMDLALEPGMTFVLGSEREGLPDDLVAACDEAATIPVAPGAESLNVAMAGTIALYEWARRNRRR
jgi:TrmH family RNA methyltransferase